jgi:hypothetical protein
MATLEQLSAALVKADAAGNAEDAKAFANAIRQMQAAPVAAPSEIPVARQAPGAMTQLGRSAASLADVTVGGVIPAVVQQVAYPFLRVGRSPEEATARTQSLVSGLEKPFGKTFGVTETPEYQQEASRQIMDFIGQNFQKGAKWISERTGVPASDVENIIGTATIAAPKVAPVVAREAVKAGKQVAENVAVAAKMPFEKQIQARRERMSAEDYARGPQIDAAADAQRLGIALNPADIEPSVSSRTYSAIAGPRGPEALTQVNRPRVAEIAKNEMELPATTQLNGRAAFDQARAQVAAPYEQIKKLPIQQADDAMIQRLEGIRTDLDVIGAKEYAPAISKIVDDAIAKTQTGLTGEALLKNISVLRERARKTYNNKAATTEALDIADTNLKIATELESMIDNSIFNPKLLGEYRDARQKMARTYAYEGATDFNTGIVDVSKLARITAKDNGLTGDIASLGRIAGNFPDVFSTSAASKFYDLPRLSRSGLAGSMGALAGSYFGGTPGLIIGGLASSGVGELAGAAAARRMASPNYQAGLNLRDMRLPVNQLAASMQPIPQNRAVVPYEAPVEVLGPGEGPYQPNFVIQPNQYGGRVVPGTPEAPRNMLGYDPNAPVQGQPNAFDIMRQRERDLSMRQGTAAEQQAAAAEAAARQPTRGGVEFVFDSAGNLVPAPVAGAGGVMPSALESAVAKMSGQVIEQPSTTFKTQTISPKTGAQPYTRITKREGEPTFERGVSQAFAMTAEEKIAWNKAKADLAEVMPGMKALDDKAIASKMMDREWVQQAIVNAEQKAKLQDEILARSTNEKARRLAQIERDKLEGTLELLEEQYRKARPVKTGGQGPKTRNFQRNMLAPEQEIQNALAERAVKIDLKGMAK